MLEGSDRPIMMQCTVSLPVEVRVDVRRGDTVERFTFRADTDTLGNVLTDVAGTTPVQRSGEHIIAVERVRPYPLVDASLSDDDYMVTLRVTRNAAHEPVTPGLTSIPAHLDEPVTLAISQTAVFQPAGVAVTVAGVADDRCPALSICKPAPIVVVDLDVSQGGAAHRVRVGGVSDGSGRITGPLMETSGIPWAQSMGYTIELLAVTPYPQPFAANAPTTYAITLVVGDLETRQPKPTPAPAPTSALPVLSFDASGYPLLCVSERALVDMAAGMSNAPPVASTPLPIGADSLVSPAAGGEICAMFFDATWRAATTDDLTMSFADYLPPAGAFWAWDEAAGAFIPWEAGQ
jgi:hypothetical protein